MFKCQIGSWKFDGPGNLLKYLINNHNQSHTLTKKSKRGDNHIRDGVKWFRKSQFICFVFYAILFSFCHMLSFFVSRSLFVVNCVCYSFFFGGPLKPEPKTGDFVWFCFSDIIVRWVHPFSVRIFMFEFFGVIPRILLLEESIRSQKVRLV